MTFTLCHKPCFLQLSIMKNQVSFQLFWDRVYRVGICGSCSVISYSDSVCHSGMATSCLALTWCRKAAAETGVAGVNGEAIIGIVLNDVLAGRRRQICWMMIQMTSTARQTTTLTATAAADMLLSYDSATYHQHHHTSHQQQQQQQQHATLHIHKCCWRWR